MARTAIEMPKLGYDMETGTIGEWLKQVGDAVARGDVIAEIETEKAHGRDGSHHQRDPRGADLGTR